ncbi:MAG: DUF1778 domain-containing protein [Elusimicrobia bacterium]|nr:DUF1778 domain-containing protein [Elusimicrobiota bacterium]
MATKTDRLDMRLTTEQKDLLERAAAISGQPLTGFALSHLLEAAQDLIESHQRTVLSLQDGRRFLEILEADEVPAPALTAALRRRRARRA